MVFNKYIAFGFAGGAITTTAPYRTVREASLAFFKENPREHKCSVRRVAATPSGETRNDMTFKVRTVMKEMA